MANYAILNVKTVSTVSSMASIQAERIRAKDYVNVDKDRSKDNLALSENQDIVALYNNAMKHDYYSKPDKWGRMHKEPTVKAVNLVLTYSPGAHLEDDRRQFYAWMKANAEFVRDLFPGCPKVATLHMDEATPHMHVSIVPVTKSGKISKNQFIPNRQRLVEIQDAYAEKMAQFGLSRGIGRNAEERAQATTEYKSLREEIARLKAEVDDLKQQRESLQEFLPTRFGADYLDQARGSWEDGEER